MRIWQINGKNTEFIGKCNEKIGFGWTYISVNFGSDQDIPGEKKPQIIIVSFITVLFFFKKFGSYIKYTYIG